MDLNLKDKVVLVTGASSGVGKAIAFSFAAEGAKVVVNYLKNEAKGLDFGRDAQSVVDEIAARYGTRAAAVAGDLAHEEQIVGMFDAAEASLGPVDVLVNNAAYCPKGPIEAYSVEEWNYTFQVNVTGCFVACRELIKRLRARGAAGRIVNIASQAAFLGSTSGHLPYDSSKGALVSMTRAIARETAREGILVNAIAPGMVMTEMIAKIWEARKEQYLARIPLNRIAQPEEVARVVVFLASEAASYMTGTTLDLTGGLMMR